MFHHTHVYVATKLYQSKDPLLILGSFLPDLAVMGIIKWDGGLHGAKSTASFSKFIQKYPSSTSLYKGVLAHNILDDYTHTNYHGVPGYAFQNNDKLVNQIKKYYDLDKDRAKGIAHNYIESAVDIMLLKDHSEVQGLIKKIVKTKTRDEIINLCSSYFKIDKNEFSKALLEFYTLFTKYDFAKKNSWLLFWKDLEELLSLKDIGVENREVLLNKALNIVENTYNDFLNFSIQNGLKKVTKLDISGN